MPGIVCAIRGGPRSRPTIEKAIALAEEKQQKVFFLYVMNLDFLSQSLHSHISTMTAEIRGMGEFILLAAEEKALRQNVDSEGVIRKGEVRAEIIALSQEIEAEFVLLGRPQTQEDPNVFEESTLTEFAQQIEKETAANVVFVGS